MERLPGDDERRYFGGRAWLVDIPAYTDDRGSLQVFSFDRMPFTPVRSFAVTDVPAGIARGGHAHRSGKQMLVCLHGRIEILMRCGHEEVALIMGPTSPALVFGPGVWCEQRYVEQGSVLLVFASEPYAAESYMEHWSGLPSDTGT